MQTHCWRMTLFMCSQSSLFSLASIWRHTLYNNNNNSWGRVYFCFHYYSVLVQILFTASKREVWCFGLRRKTEANPKASENVTWETSVGLKWKIFWHSLKAYVWYWVISDLCNVCKTRFICKIRPRTQRCPPVTKTLRDKRSTCSIQLHLSFLFDCSSCVGSGFSSCHTVEK